LRFLISTCWLIGAGGGWALALAGLAAGARGVALADLVLVGGAASWIGMLVTAFRPGKRPNTTQWVLAGLSWVMPLAMLAMLGEFDGRLVVLAFATSVCVAMIVVIIPSQSYEPDIDAERRLRLHLHEVAAREKRRQRAEQERSVGGAEGGNGPAAQELPAATETDEPPAGREGEEQEESSRSRWQTPTVKRRGRIGSSGGDTSSGDRR